MIKQLLNSVIVICQYLEDQLFASVVIDLLATNKSRYFAQARPTVAGY